VQAPWARVGATARQPPRCSRADGKVHSAESHYFALCQWAAHRNLGARMRFHVILDGRDTPPNSGEKWVSRLETHLKRLRSGARISTVSGRYWPMDRDMRWERIHKAWSLYRFGHSQIPPAASAVDAVRQQASRGVSDEFVEPVEILGGDGRWSDGDAIIFFNYRADRGRQIAHVALDEDFPHFDRGSKPNLFYVTMSEYEAGLTPHLLYEPFSLDHLLTDVLAERGLKQLRLAETEKYAHVTYFFNGGREKPPPGEERILVSSPKVATFDLVPEMAVHEIGAEYADAATKGMFDVAVLNFANPDMLGHTGNYEATCRALTEVDLELGRIWDHVSALGGHLIVTSDHGNCEQMWDDRNNCPHTAHTTNPVPIYVAGPRTASGSLRRGGALADVAPTMLDILELPMPDEMTGESLIVKG
jgi:2,3-bisphosphoglycerate-independent phosphoglycerate mutase